MGRPRSATSDEFKALRRSRRGSRHNAARLRAATHQQVSRPGQPCRTGPVLLAGAASTSLFPQLHGSRPAVIHVQGLRKKFGSIEAVRDVSFDVEDGTVVGLLGPNGAGKTTTL